MTPAFKELTVKEFAEQERVSVRTVYEWIRKGAIQVRRTPGGGIRIQDRRHHPRTSTNDAASA